MAEHGPLKHPPLGPAGLADEAGELTTTRIVWSHPRGPVSMQPPVRPSSSSATAQGCGRGNNHRNVLQIQGPGTAPSGLTGTGVHCVWDPATVWRPSGPRFETGEIVRLGFD